MQAQLETARIIKSSFYTKLGKRLLDVFVSVLALIILSLIFIVIGLLIKIDSKGPIIYKQKRVGRYIKDFYVFKFRTMIVNADKIGPKRTPAGDKRITRVGKFLRTYSLDELPQLVNVFVGSMSLVGYRPGVRENYNPDFLNSNLFNLKPGLTGYAQINGRSTLSVEDKRQWELKYLNDISFVTDIRIMLITAKKVIMGEGTT